MTISRLERTPSRSERRIQTARLLAEAAQTSDPTTRKLAIDEVIVLNVGVAQAIARRFNNRGIASDDLEQVAYLALTRAAQKFDPGQERDFLTYAVPTITGELKRHFRDAGWTIRPPRRIQEIQSKVIHAYKSGEEAGRPPSARRLAEQLGLPEADVSEALTVDGCFAPVSLDRPSAHVDGVGITAGELLVDPADDVDGGAAEARLLLAPALAHLPDRDQRIVHLRFVEERTQSEIGEELGITQMQVSRLLKRIMRDLRRAIGDTAAA